MEEKERFEGQGEYDKKYYKIRDVAEMLGVPQSTLRYWEQEFPECSPRRSATNIRYYSPKDIELLKVINYLVKVKGLRIEAAREQLHENQKNISRRKEIIDLLTSTKEELEGILSSLTKRKN